MTKAALYLLVFLLTSSVAWAYQPPDLSQHGSNLKNVSFPIRYKFEQKYGKEWSSSTYVQRKKFLTYWYEEKVKQEKLDRLKNKEISRREKEIAKNKKNESKRLARLAKDDAKVIVNEHKDKKRSKKKIDRAESVMQKEIRMQRN